MNKRLEPKLFSILRKGYSSKQFSSDLTAGIIVGIVSLPLAIAFAIASGVKPEQGLYTAIIAGFVIALFGGSRAQVSGPTGAFIVIIYGIVHQYGYSGLAIATVLAGIMLVIMGIARMGVLLKFIPYPVTVGFTSGIALIIFSSQMHDFFGLRMEDVPADFLEKWAAYGESFASLHLPSLLVGIGSLLIIVLWPRITKRIPGSLIALVVATAVVTIFRLPVDTIGSQFGGMPSHFPSPHIPHISWKLATKMFSPAITIALLAALESLLSAVVADGMLGTRHRSNMELSCTGNRQYFISYLRWNSRNRSNCAYCYKHPQRRTHASISNDSFCSASTYSSCCRQVGGAYSYVGTCSNSNLCCIYDE